ncbi:signal peptidase II [Catenuloplanes atrovinosus]|uniref:Lipoprotein signal peptidase n=1 Tax=Catenuloplanes atrovinosus TaxID=137266 RepID=A0AAE3YTJ8_9ACTN|nr:signal peptidase II [Catenuloplanes atrovinosus]MDR7278148.1 signal peptidase II [Catenuloplanes atrovinosus]
MTVEAEQPPAERSGDAAGASAPGSVRRAVTVLGAVASVMVAADFATKELALATLNYRDDVTVIPGVLYWSLIRNSGAAFSLGADYTWIFPIVTIAVVIWIGWMATRLRSIPWAISLGLVLGGALGNLVDRIFREPSPFLGHVVDFVSVFQPGGGAFPIFNVADSSLSVGVVLAVLLELSGRQRDGSRISSDGGRKPAPGDSDEKDSTSA